MDNLKEKFENMHLLDRDDRRRLLRILEMQKFDFLDDRFRRPCFGGCTVKVLIVCDGGLNFNTGAFGLSEFLTTFNELQASTCNDYEVTVAHRGSVSLSPPNPIVANQISGFNFATSMDLTDFDQMWLFAIQSRESDNITTAEKNAIATYMNSGRGLFATGDHGQLGRSMCGDILRVKDMRYWSDTTNDNDTNEVSMTGRRRNDTNRPTHGDARSQYFDNQSDDIPQEIAVRTFGQGMPHPLLSIKTSLRASGIIDIMPDHPHEGECAPETSFRVNGTRVATQIIATSFVLGGSTTQFVGKIGTVPHCFPSIAVWDGRRAGVGRIVVDSTWHHFVNTNLNGAGSGIDHGAQPGLSNADHRVVQQYYMNIALWMTHRRNCFPEVVVAELLRNSQLIEANLNNPNLKLEEIPIADLNSIGALAEEILGSRHNPAFARDFLLELIREQNSDLVEALDIWNEDVKESWGDHYYHDWLNLDLILWTSIGTGFIALRNDTRFNSDEAIEEYREAILDTFTKGVDYGFNLSMENLQRNVNDMIEKLRR